LKKLVNIPVLEDLDRWLNASAHSKLFHRWFPEAIPGQMHQMRLSRMMIASATVKFLQ
jgi:hypothetical protein